MSGSQGSLLFPRFLCSPVFKGLGLAFRLLRLRRDDGDFGDPDPCESVVRFLGVFDLGNRSKVGRKMM